VRQAAICLTYAVPLLLLLLRVYAAQSAFGQLQQPYEADGVDAMAVYNMMIGALRCQARLPLASSSKVNVAAAGAAVMKAAICLTYSVPLLLLPLLLLPLLLLLLRVYAAAIAFR
jgi:hypothetical protein